MADPKPAVIDARAMIAAKREDPKRYADWIQPADLPASLRIPGLKCAVVHEDHVDLLLRRIPDWWAGARIWSVDARRKHADQPTRYADVGFFTYTNDQPESPENLR